MFTAVRKIERSAVFDVLLLYASMRIPVMTYPSFTLKVSVLPLLPVRIFMYPLDVLAVISPFSPAV